MSGCFLLRLELSASSISFQAAVGWNAVGDISYTGSESAADSVSEPLTASEPSRERLRGTKRSLSVSQTPEPQKQKTRAASREAARKPLGRDSPAENGGKQSGGSPPVKPEWRCRGGSGWNKGLRAKHKGQAITLQNAVPAGKGKGGPGRNKGLRRKDKGLALTAQNAVPAAAAVADVLKQLAKDTAAKARKAASPAAEQRPEAAEPMQLQRNRVQSKVQGEGHVVQGESPGPGAGTPSAGPQETLPLAGKAFKQSLWS